jgi:mannitol/fructose-specific phosphotransferase system IIA component (Ntr-type)
LIETGHLDAAYREEAIAALRHREDTMSTGIGFGIAIPHASCDAVKEVTACFARSKAGVDFESLDEKPVHYIVLFLVPKDQFQTHLRTLAAIAKFLNDPVVRGELASAPDAAAILQVFERKAA